MADRREKIAACADRDRHEKGIRRKAELLRECRRDRCHYQNRRRVVEKRRYRHRCNRDQRQGTMVRQDRSGVRQPASDHLGCSGRSQCIADGDQSRSHDGDRGVEIGIDVAERYRACDDDEECSGEEGGGDENAAKRNRGHRKR